MMVVLRRLPSSPSTLIFDVLVLEKPTWKGNDINIRAYILIPKQTVEKLAGHRVGVAGRNVVPAVSGTVIAELTTISISLL